MAMAPGEQRSAGGPVLAAGAGPAGAPDAEAATGAGSADTGGPTNGARSGGRRPVNGSSHVLEAPHRRREGGGSRRLEMLAVRLYRVASWLLSHVPARPVWWVGGWVLVASYYLWPKKRRFVDANYGHVLGLPPGDPAVGRMARRAYRHYARYSVELMRLPSMSAEEAGRRLDNESANVVAKVLKESKGGVILVVAHLANNEMAAYGFAAHGLPISVVADDTSFEEMFELLRRQRSAWNLTMIPWRNIRAVYQVLRRHEILGLLVDWGYRPDGIPVQMFGSWTTLPAGPAVLAARNKATILTVTLRRGEDGTLLAQSDEPFTVPSDAPHELRRASQRIASFLERGIAAAPDQWYIFKPIWPDSPEEQRELARLAAESDAAGAPA